eukprot:1028132-Pleurochrysis_carterae.AAC.1
MLRRPLCSALRLCKVLQLPQRTPPRRGAILEECSVSVDESCPLLADGDVLHDLRIIGVVLLLIPDPLGEALLVCILAMLRRPLLSASRLDKVLQLSQRTSPCRGAILE